MGSLRLNLSGPVPSEIDQELLNKAVGQVNADQNPPDGEINLAFTDDAGIQKLNRDYSGNDYSTDVLSFSYMEDGGPIEGVLGEIIISSQTAQRQAKEAGTSLSEEAAILTIHGILHILGVDHQTPPQQEQMNMLQSKYAALLGIKYRNFNWQ